MIDVTVKVPEDRVGEFYAMLGRWLTGRNWRMTHSVRLSPGSRTGRTHRRTLCWPAWVGKLSPRAKAVFSLLMDHPGRQVSGEDLASACDIPNGKYGVAGVLAWPVGTAQR